MNMHRKIPAERARQASKGRPVLLILVAALVLTALAWWVAEIYGEATDPQVPGQATPNSEPAPRPTG